MIFNQSHAEAILEKDFPAAAEEIERAITDVEIPTTENHWVWRRAGYRQRRCGPEGHARTSANLRSGGCGWAPVSNGSNQVLHGRTVVMSNASHLEKGSYEKHVAIGSVLLIGVREASGELSVMV